MGTADNFENKLFHIGTTNSYDPVAISNNMGLDDFTVGVRDASAGFIAPIFNFAQACKREWNITSASTGAFVEFEPGATCAGGTSLVVGHYVGNAWVGTPNVPIPSRNPNVFGLTYGAAFTSFSPFAVGSCDAFYANSPPSVSLTAPTDNAVAITNLTLSATASDANGSVSRVNFYTVQNSSRIGTTVRTLIGSDDTAPYSYDWTNIVGGKYTIQAEGVDDCGASTFSSTASVNILETFSVLLTSPSGIRTFVPGSSLTLAASVSSFTSRTVVKVEFYDGNIKLGEDLTAPYTYLWSNIPAGIHAILAKAIDNTGAAWSSGIYLITGTETVSGNVLQTVNTARHDWLLEVSPNPTHQQVTIHTVVPEEGIYRFNLMDMMGRVLFTKNTTLVKGENAETLNVSNLSRGVYFIRLTDTKSSEIKIQKLVID